jgi:hypothetical protein
MYKLYKLVDESNPDSEKILVKELPITDKNLDALLLECVDGYVLEECDEYVSRVLKP